MALARVFSTWGSAPRPVGSVMMIREDGHFEGSVSGGCVESDVQSEAQTVIATGNAAQLSYGVTNSQAWEVGLACGGKIEIYVELVTDRLGTQLTSISDTLTQRRPCALVTDITTHHSDLYLPPKDAVPSAVATFLAENKSGRADDTALFIHTFQPPLRLYIIGAVHITQALTSMATMLDMEVTVIDPRSAFANAARFPNITLDNRWPDEALQAARLDARSAVVTLTHDPKLDDAALHVALQTPAFYIGCLGSQKTQAARLKRLEKEGIATDTLTRIHGPVGLDIGSKSPAEIAASIAAELISVLRRGA